MKSGHCPQVPATRGHWVSAQRNDSRQTRASTLDSHSDISGGHLNFSQFASDLERSSLWKLCLTALVRGYASTISSAIISNSVTRSREADQICE